MTLEVDILTLFPGMLEGPLSESIPRRIQERGLAVIRVHDLRGWGLGRHRSVDDYTYGGGAGMVLRPEPVAGALAALRRDDSLVILLDPAGEPFRQERAQSLSAATHLVLLCPRYEGVDDRIRALVDAEISIGDYVLTGGELAALVVVDAVLRLLPGAIEAGSTVEESFAAGLLEYPQYTRPPRFMDMAVPEVLVSGDHGAVRRWRLKASLRRTLVRRPDLLEGRVFTAEERRLLDEISAESEAGADGLVDVPMADEAAAMSPDGVPQAGAEDATPDPGPPPDPGLPPHPGSAPAAGTGGPSRRRPSARAGSPASRGGGAAEG